VSYLALLGSTGFEELGRVNFERGQELAERITSLHGFQKKFSGFHFNEFVIQCEHDPQKVNNRLLQKGIQGGLVLDPMWFPELSDCILIGVSEMHSDEDIDRFITALKETTHV
jgi:glycine dehydrogenase subunit 1